MASVDNRIVNMTFNNAEFERRISETIKSLGTLDNTIANVSSKNGLGKLAESANKFDLSGMTSAIEGVSAKFLALSTIGITALANITNRAIDAGIQITKSLSLDQIIGGFSEYELKMGSIQTIMAGSGASLETVNQKLQELNEYSDKTIYSFADMTTNIGKFTNAGVDLDTAVAAIQGVANVAARSGADANEASRAMYNFGQALGAGSVKLMDWKSIELANMGTVEFKEQLIDAAVAAGTLTRAADGTTKTLEGTEVTTSNFGQTLQDAWLTSEALTDALARYSDTSTEIGAAATKNATEVKTFTQLMDTMKESVGSGWAQTFEILIGNFDEARELFTNINSVVGDFIGKQADARNQLLQGWKDMGGRTVLIEGLTNAFGALADIVRPIKDAFREIFPAMTSERLYDLTVRFRDFTEMLKPSEGTINNIRRIFLGLFNVLDVGWEILKFGVGIIKDFVQELTGIGGGGALSGLAKVGDVLASISAESVIGGLKKAADAIRDFFTAPLPYIGALISKIGDFFSFLGGNIPDISGPFGGVVDFIKNAFLGLGDALSGIDLPSIPTDKIFETIGNFFTGIKDRFIGFFSTGGELATGVADAGNSIDWELVLGGVGLGIVGGLIATVNKLIKNGINIDFTGGVFSSIAGAFDELGGVLKAYQTDLKANAILKIAAAIGVLAAALIALSFVSPEDLVKASVAIGVSFGQLAAAIKIIEKLAFSPSDAAKFALMSLSLGVLSVSMVLFAGSMKIFGTMDWGEMAKGGLAFAAIVGAIILLSHTIGNEAAGMIKASAAMLLMSFSMGSMAKAISKFGEMDTAVMIQGFIGLSAAMALLVGTMQLLPKDMEKKTAGLVGFSIALNLMVFAIKQLGKMQLGELVQGGIAFAGMLGILVLALNKMPVNIAAKASQLIALAAAMVIMGVAIKQFAGLSWEEMIRGLTGMAGALAILVVGMSAASGGLAGAAALIVISGAMLLLSAAIAAFATIGIGNFITGLIMMGVAIGALAGVALLLTPALPALMGLGVALGLIGFAVGAVGFGIAQIAKALAILAKIGPEAAAGIDDVLFAVGKSIPALLAGVAAGIIEMVSIFTGAIPVFVEFIVKLVAALLDALTVLLPKFGEFFVSVVTTILTVITELTPTIVSAGLNLLLALIQGIAENIGEIVTVVVTVITEFINAIAENLPTIIEAGLNLLLAFLEGITLYISFIAEAVTLVITTLITEIAGHAGEIIAAGTQALTEFLQGITDSISLIIGTITTVITQLIADIASFADDIITAGADALVQFLQGISDNLSTIITTVGEVITQFIEDVGTFYGDIAEAGFDVLVELLSGLTDNMSEVISAVSDMIQQIILAVGFELEELVDAGVDMVVSLLEKMGDSAIEIADAVGQFARDVATAIENVSEDFEAAGRSIAGSIADGMTFGLAGKVGSVVSGAKDLAGKVVGGIGSVFGIGSPSKVMIEMGVNLADGLALGMKNETVAAVSQAEKMATDVISVMGRVADGVAMSLQETGALNPTITPVLDLSNVTAGARTIAATLDAGYLQANSIASTRTLDTEDDELGGVREIKFEQNNFSPKELSTAEIYKQTRNQITMAKEELSIP